ncbi:annexin D8 [Cucumis melo var. makuwa]|uniref:Annexin n=2 Tax=Cucumis melo TaxID=3656 RepID=A0A5D3DWM6_CUCMM|nr:annexin D8 [Cucumis melo var. makuwa]TYK27715.1 annexin D8 [Cucumis melo var. makuwa]
MATLIAPKYFSPVEDAENIKKACLGLGTDENAIISILGHRNANQRKLIRLAYEEIYNEDLIQQLNSELCGDFERAISHWTLDPADRDAILANNALKASTPDYRVIIEIACVRSAEDLLAVKRAYRFRFKHSLEEDVASCTTKDMRKLLVGVVSAYRCEGNEIDENMAELEANIIDDEIKGKGCKNNEEIIRIVSTRSKPQLNATFNRYRDIHGTSITKGLIGDSSDEYLAALKTVIRCIRDPKKYYAKVLRNAMNTIGVDRDGISRVIVTRAEKDLKEIMEMYLKRNNISLEEAVSREIGGDYKAFLLALLGVDQPLNLKD